MRCATTLLGASVTVAVLWVGEVLAGNANYDALVLADSPLFFWSFDESDGSAVNLAEPIPENDLIPQGNATRELHNEIGSGLLLGRTASFDGEEGIPGSLEASRFYAPDLRGDPTPGINNDSPGYDFIESQLWAVEMWLQVTGDNTIGDADRQDYLIESFNGTNIPNDPGLIYDFNADELEMFGGGGRTGPGNGSTIEDEDWHHVIFAFYGNDGGFGIADRQDIVIDGEFHIDGSPGFSSGFGLQDFSLGATTRNLTQAFEGRIDEVAIYDVGTMLLDQGFTIDLQNEEAEAAFEQFVAHLAETRPNAAMGEPLTGDYNNNGKLDAPDLDLQAIAIRDGGGPEYDLDSDGEINFADREIWVSDLKNTWIGDANLDLEFNSSDMVQVFVGGKYELDQDAKWEEGDWDGNLRFSSGDMVAAFVAGGYEQGQRADAVAAVPEPTSVLLLLTGLIGVATCRLRPRV